jgi:hypothetical protein
MRAAPPPRPWSPSKTPPPLLRAKCDRGSRVRRAARALAVVVIALLALAGGTGLRLAWDHSQQAAPASVPGAPSLRAPLDAPSLSAPVTGRSQTRRSPSRPR